MNPFVSKKCFTENHHPDRATHYDRSDQQLTDTNRFLFADLHTHIYWALI